MGLGKCLDRKKIGFGIKINLEKTKNIGKMTNNERKIDKDKFWKSDIIIADWL